MDPYDVLLDASLALKLIVRANGWSQQQAAKKLLIRWPLFNGIYNASLRKRSEIPDELLPTDDHPRVQAVCNQITEYAFLICSRPNYVAVTDVDPENVHTPFGKLYEWHKLTLREFRDRIGSGQQDTKFFTDLLAHHLPMFFAMAMTAHGDYRRRMLMNYLLTVANVMDKAGAAGLEDSLVKKTLRQVYAAMRQARQEVLADGMEGREWDMWGLGAHVITWCGMLLGEKKLVTRGIRRVLRAVAKRPQLVEGHWANAMMILEALLARDFEKSLVKTWAEDLLTLAEARKMNAQKADQSDSDCIEGDEFMRSFGRLDTAKPSSRLPELAHLYRTGLGNRLHVLSVKFKTNLRKSAFGGLALSLMVAAALLLGVGRSKSIGHANPKTFLEKATAAWKVPVVLARADGREG